MTLKQLGFLREIARQSLNISSAAVALHTSQPGVSRQLQELERDLGVELLVRRKNRVLALTDAGHEILAAAQRMLNEADNIRRLAADRRNERGGRLALATRHLHVRYPIVGYSPRSRGGQIIAKTFRDHGIDARFVVSANDSDVIKAYVEEGLGIAIVPTLAAGGGAWICCTLRM